MISMPFVASNACVSLFTREWIEIVNIVTSDVIRLGLPLYEGVD